MRAAQAYIRMGTVNKLFPGASKPFASVAAIHTSETHSAQHPSPSEENYVVCCTMMLQAFRHPQVNLGDDGGGRNGRGSRHRRFARFQPKGADRGCVENA